MKLLPGPHKPWQNKFSFFLLLSDIRLVLLEFSIRVSSSHFFFSLRFAFNTFQSFQKVLAIYKYFNQVLHLVIDELWLALAPVGCTDSQRNAIRGKTLSVCYSPSLNAEFNLSQQNSLLPLFVPFASSTRGPPRRRGVLCKARRGRNEGLHGGYTSVPGLESSCQYSLCSLLGRSPSKPSSSSPPGWLGSAYVLQDRHGTGIS